MFSPEEIYRKVCWRLRNYTNARFYIQKRPKTDSVGGTKRRFKICRKICSRLRNYRNAHFHIPRRQKTASVGGTTRRFKICRKICSRLMNYTNARFHIPKRPKTASVGGGTTLRSKKIGLPLLTSKVSKESSFITRPQDLASVVTTPLVSFGLQVL